MAEALSMPAYARLRDRLRADILAGDWAPGTHRTLGSLAAQHGVSMSPVREALLSLEGEGLIDIRQHRGAVVPVLDRVLFENLYDMRGALQSLLSRRAAERATRAQVAAMAAHEAAYAEAAAVNDPLTALAANQAFHDVLEEAAANPIVASIYRARSAFVNAARLRLGFGPARMAQAVVEHRAMLAAIAAGDAEAAAATGFDHAMAAKQDLIARLGEETTYGTHHPP